MEPIPLREGRTLGDRYILRRQAWPSALGPVWVGRDTVLDRPVLVQVLDARLAADPTVRHAFGKAAARVAQVNHAGLLQVYDIGEEPAFAVFEHAAGARLRDRLRAGPLRVTDAVRAALTIARALEALHERGAWHGSLSPDNVLFDEEGRAKVFATGEADTARAAPASAAVLQAPTYRTAEAEAMPADADRYALAALTYEMLTGKAPSRPWAPARTIRRSIPAAIDEVLRRALSGDPAERPGLDELIGALAPYARVEPPSAARVPRFAGSDFRWLATVVLIVALGAAAAIVGLTVDLSAPDGDGAPQPTEAPRETLTVAEVTDFDPQGDGEEHAEQTGRTIDGDPRSAWETLGYASGDRLDGRKQGVGLLFDLGGTAPVERILVQTTREGWTAEVRVAGAAGASPDDYRRVTSFTAGTETDVSLPKGTEARYVLIWITRLVDDGSGRRFPYRAAVSEVEFFRA